MGNSVIVSVKRHGEDKEIDMELPLDIKIEELSDMISTWMKWTTDSKGNSIKYAIQASPPGRVINMDETLKDASVLDGASIVLFKL